MESKSPNKNLRGPKSRDRRRARRPKNARDRDGYTNTPPTHSQTTAQQYMLRQCPVFLTANHLQKGMLYYEAGTQLSPLTTGAAVGYVFTANGIFDPNITSTGHQPMGFDQLMALYSQYCVVNSTITVRFNAFQSTLPLPVAVYLNPDATPLTSATQIVENGFVFTRLLPGFSGTYSPSVEITLNCDVAKYFRRDYRSIVDDADLHGTAAANPTEQVYFIITSWQGLGNVATTTVHFDVIISYDVIFTEPRKLASS